MPSSKAIHPKTLPAKIVESPPQQTSWVHPFACKQFHVLLNSLFKVLCNFPSRYLFAIGYVIIFSLRRSLPPALGCTFKQPDSSMQGLASISVNDTGLAPALVRPYSKGLSKTSKDGKHPSINVASRYTFRCRAFTLGSSRFTRRY